MAADVPLFNKNKHISYWLRCLRTPLPTAYTSNDSNRMMLSFFILSALDLLGVLFTRTSPAERREYADWIYKCQHPSGGFRGFPGTDFGQRRSDKNAVWDPANLAATYFALSGLCVLGDDLEMVDRRACLQWLSTVQREDGSFGELKTSGDQIIGGGDDRFAYMAAGIRWILRGEMEEPVEGLADIDVKGLVNWINSTETRDGGYSTDSYHEAHAGLTFCAIAAQCLLGNTHGSSQDSASVATRNPPHKTSNMTRVSLVGVSQPFQTIQFLTSRLTTEIDEDDFEMAEGTVSSNSAFALEVADQQPPTTSENRSFTKLRSQPAIDRYTGKLGLDSDAFHAECMKPVSWTGFAGRCNKIADTCYNFWAGASLKILGVLDLVDLEHIQCYLLDKTQHLIMGGFGKTPGDLPDIYHAYLGLAALSIISGNKTDGAYIGPDIEGASKVIEGRASRLNPAPHENDDDRTLRTLDPVLCMSTNAKRWIETFEWRRRG